MIILIVDGVWASVQCASEDFWEDQAGHLRKLRHAEDRVILVAMAVWPDGTQTVLHYEMVRKNRRQRGYCSLSIYDNGDCKLME